MRTLYFLLQKEFKQIFRNKNILRMILIVPIMQLIVMPLAADYEIKNIKIAIVDHDHSTFSENLMEQTTASGYFLLTSNPSSFNEAYSEFETDKADLILEIPAKFEQQLLKEQNQQLYLAVNAINGVKASVGSAYLMRIIQAYNAQIQLKQVSSNQPNALAQIKVDTIYWYNRFLNYATFMVPGVLVLLVTMVGSYMCALNIVKEKEIGTIEQINVTPIKKHWFILGKLIPFWIIGVFVFSIGLFGVARIIYNIIPVGSLAILYLFLAIYLFALLGIGLIISNYSSNQQQAMSLAFFAMMIFALMGGLFTSISSMPQWAQYIAAVNPVTYFIDVVRLIILKGSGFKELTNQFLVIGFMAIFFNTWAVLSYTKTN